MAEKSKTTLKALFETGDSATEANFTDLIDSALNLADTTAQTVAGPVTFSGPIGAAAVSANSVEGSAAVFGGIVSASAIYTESLFVAGGEVQAAGGGARGQLSITATAETSIGSTGTYELVNGTMTVQGSQVQFSALSTSELKYVGDVPRTFRISCAFSIKTAANNKLTSMAPSVDGSARSEFEIERQVGTATDAGAVFISSFLSANVSARLGVMIANKTDAANLTADKMILSISQV